VRRASHRWAGVLGGFAADVAAAATGIGSSGGPA
jgi:hypothetical protein